MENQEQKDDWQFSDDMKLVGSIVVGIFFIIAGIGYLGLIWWIIYQIFL